MDDNILNVGVNVDASSIGRSKRSLRELRTSVLDFVKSAEAEARALEQSVTEFRDYDASQRASVREVEARIEATRRAVIEQNDLTDALRRSTDAEQRAGAARPRGGIPDFEGADRQNSRIREAAGALGDLDSALSAIGAEGPARIFELAEALPQLTGAAQAAPASITATANAIFGTSATFGTVAAAAGIAAPALIGVGVAFNSFVQTIQEGQELLATAIERRVEIEKLLITGNREAIEAALERAQVEQQALENTAAAIETNLNKVNVSFDSVVQSVNESSNILGQASRLFEDAFGPEAFDNVARFVSQFSFLDEIIVQVVESLGKFFGKRGLEDVQQQAAEAAASAQEYSEALEQLPPPTAAATEQVEALAEGAASTADQVDSLAESVDNLEEPTNKAAEATDRLGRVLFGSADQTIGALGLIEDSFTEFTDSTVTSVAITTRFIDEAVGLINSRFADLPTFSGGGDDDSKVSIGIPGEDDLPEDDPRAKALEDRIEDITERLADAEEDYQKRLSEAIDDYQESLLDAEQKFQNRQAELLEEKNRRIADIESEFSDTVREAELSRNARTLRDAIKQREEDIEDAEEAYEDGLKSAEEAFNDTVERLEERLADVTERLAEQLENLTERLEEQITDLTARLTKILEGGGTFVLTGGGTGGGGSGGNSGPGFFVTGFDQGSSPLPSSAAAGNTTIVNLSATIQVPSSTPAEIARQAVEIITLDLERAIGGG